MILVLAIVLVCVLIPLGVFALVVNMDARWQAWIVSLEHSSSPQDARRAARWRRLTPGRGHETRFPWLYAAVGAGFVVILATLLAFTAPFTLLGVRRHRTLKVRPPDSPIEHAIWAITQNPSAFLNDLGLPSDFGIDVRSPERGVIEVDVEIGGYQAKETLPALCESVEEHPLIRGFTSRYLTKTPRPGWVRFIVSLVPLPEGKVGPHMVSKADILGVEASDQLLDDPKKLWIGYEGAGRNLHLDLDVSEDGIVAGPKGRGKTAFVRLVLTQLLSKYNTAAGDWSWDAYVLSLKDDADFWDLEPWLAGFKGARADESEWVGMLQTLVALMEQQMQTIGNLGYRDIDDMPREIQPRRVFWLVDESRLLFDINDDDASRAVWKLSKLGRSAGFHGLLTEQMPRTEGFSKKYGAAIMGNAPLRISFGHLPQGVKGVFFDGYEGIDLGSSKTNIPGRGVGLKLNERDIEPVEFQALYLRDDVAHAILSTRDPTKG